MKFTNNTGLLVADTSINPYHNIALDNAKLNETFSKYILSASGFRNQYSKDEEDRTVEISSEDKIITHLIASSFFSFLNCKNPKILIGMDSRPTGSSIANIAIATLLSLGCEVSFIFISSAPQAMAYSKNFDAFFYVSASHNPIAHNGFKMGIDGGVFNKEEAGVLIQILKDKVANFNSLDSLIYDEEQMNNVYSSWEEENKKSLDYYKEFVLKTAKLDSNFKVNNIGIVADFNGSARSVTIDEEFLSSIGVKFHSINNKVREVAHSIIPEGENLLFCAAEAEKLHKLDKDITLGYMCDNDGDRGNFIYYNEGFKTLEAQEGFALLVAIAIANQDLNKESNIAVAVNCATSLRIKEIASYFNAKVFTGEVGEANMVNLALKCIKDGYNVNILGEGSNGGNITFPAKVRDPLNSIMSILKLFNDENLLNHLCTKLNISGEKSISSIINSFPSYITTPTGIKDAQIKLKSKNYVALKKNYLSLLDSSLAELHSIIDFTSYSVKHTEGLVEYVNESYKSKEASGGMKIVLEEKGKEIAFLWLRPSGTEALCRVIVDVKTKDQQLHDNLLAFHRKLVLDSDK